MNRAELREIVANGGNSGVEFKRDAVDNCALAKELVALANFAGGVVVIGVDDAGGVAGISRDNLEEWVMTACRDKIRPEVIPYFEILRDIEPGKDVAVVRVERGLSVHHVWHDNHRTYYIRVGSQSREASQEELARLFQQRGVYRPEIQPVSGTTMADLDMRRLEEYFVKVRQQEAPADGDRDAWSHLLLNTEFIVQSNGTTPATLAGLLLFGSNPNRFLPQAGIEGFVFPGKEKDYNSVERAVMRGPLVRLGPANAPRDDGVLEQAMTFLQRHLSEELLEGALTRVRRWQYPPEALRETLVNAVGHRDYLLSATSIEICAYSDRLEVTSPGRLPNGITPDRMRAGCRAARNQLLKDTLRDYGYMEHTGLGVPRKIVKLTREQNGTDPELIEDGEQFIVRLWKRQ